MIKSAKTVLLFILFYTSHSFGFIYKIDRWENGSQTIFTLSDCHESIFYEKHKGNQQRQEIVQAAVELDACIIVEDQSVIDINTFIKDPNSAEYNHNYNFLIPFFDHQYSACKSPIIGLTAYCHQIRVPVDNIEFRLAKNLSIEGFDIQASTVFTFENKIIEEIQSYNDGPLLNDYYKEKLDEYLQYIKNLEPIFAPLRIQKDACLQEVIDKAFNEIKSDCSLNKEKFKNLIRFHDAALLDLRIIHSMHQHSEHSVLFICAGGWHIANIEPALQKIGFVHKETVGEPYQIKNDQFIEPDIIDVTCYFDTHETVMCNRHKELQRKLITQHDVQREKVSTSRQLTSLGLATTIGGLLLQNEKLAYRLFKQDAHLLGASITVEGIAIMLYGFYKHHKACSYKQTLLNESYSSSIGI